MNRCLRWFGAGFVMLLMSAIAVPYLVPMDKYAEYIENRVSEATGYKAEIGSIDIKILPVPSIRVNTLRITRPTETSVVQQVASKRPIAEKEGSDLDELIADKVDISFVLDSLLKGNVVITRLKLGNVVADQELLWEFIRSLKSSDDEQTSTVSSFELLLVEATELKLRLANRKVLGPYTLSLIPDMEHGFSKLSISRQDGSAHLEVTKDPMYAHFNLSAKNWKNPLGYALELQSIKAKSTQSGAFMVFSSIDAEIFGGKVEGSGQLSWLSNWKTSGAFKTSDLKLEEVMSYLDAKELSGDLDSDCKFSFSAISAKELLNYPDIKCQYQAAVFDGKISGGGHLYSYNRYSKNGWQTSGVIKSEQINLKKTLHYFDMESMAGSLNSDCRYAFSAEHVNELLDHPIISCGYKMLNGEIYKTDLEQAASMGSSEDQEPGSTPFDELSGNMTLQDSNISITNLNLVSASLQVNGEINIQKYTDLNGRIDVGVKQTASIASVPLKISGTVSEPQFRPTNDAIAGATIGTILLGPGVGTAIGVKVGSGISKLFALFKENKDPDDTEE